MNEEQDREAEVAGESQERVGAWAEAQTSLQGMPELDDTIVEVMNAWIEYRVSRDPADLTALLALTGDTDEARRAVAHAIEVVDTTEPGGPNGRRNWAYREALNDLKRLARANQSD